MCALVGWKAQLLEIEHHLVSVMSRMNGVCVWGGAMLTSIGAACQRLP